MIRVERDPWFRLDKLPIMKLLFLLFFPLISNMVFTIDIDKMNSHLSIEQRLPRVLIAHILEFADDLAVTAVSKSFNELVYEKYRRRIPFEFSEFAELLFLPNGKIDLLAARILLSINFMRKKLPFLAPYWGFYRSLKESDLHLACRCGNLDFVKLAIARGKCVNSRNSHGANPIHLAILSIDGGNDEDLECGTKIVKYLISKGAKCSNPEYDESKTPLHFACEIEAIEIIKMLLATYDTNYNYFDGNHMTALDIARARGNEEIVQMIQEYHRRRSLLMCFLEPVFFTCLFVFIATVSSVFINLFK